MIEDLKMKMGYTNRPVKVNYKDGKLEYGVIIDFLEENINASVSEMKFIPNSLLKKYEETENPSLLIPLCESRIESIDAFLK